ncbi:MAG: hypothetical protein ACOC4K_00630 [Verrucomicrobiota bacterium]
MSQYIAIFHANLNYAFLHEKDYERVIRASYETIFDTFREKCPQAKYVFEASGYTIDQMAERTPDVLEKLKNAIATGQCEFMGAPYAHPILANIPEEDGRWSNEFSMRSYERHLGFRPESAWNPECTWRQYVPRSFRDVGYKYLTLDFESYMTSSDPAYGIVERNRARDIYWGGHLPEYPLDPECKFLHRPFKDVVPGLGGLCRSDRLVGKYVSYFLGKISLEEYLDNVRKWSGSDPDGATVVIADDAEYTGTTGYYYVKHYQDYSKSFAEDPTAADKLERLVNGLLEMGEMVTFKEGCELEPVEEPFFVEDGFAWHRTYADCWAGTPEALRYQSQVAVLRYEYKDHVQPKVEGRPEFKELVEKFWFHCTNSMNSDACWPPPPGKTCDFNREWVERELSRTRAILDELKAKASSLPEPAEEPEMKRTNQYYDFWFTDKDLDEVRRLNLYELQHALYAAWREYDAQDRDEAGTGRRKIEAIFAEYQRRGIKNFVRPGID